MRSRAARPSSGQGAQQSAFGWSGAACGHALVLVIDEDGNIDRSLPDPETAIGTGINTAEPNGEFLYIASLGGRGSGRCPLGS